MFQSILQAITLLITTAEMMYLATCFNTITYVIRRVRTQRYCLCINHSYILPISMINNIKYFLKRDALICLDS